MIDYFEKYSEQLLFKSKMSFVVALDEMRVAKFGSYERLKEEAKKMSFANKINDLVVKFFEIKKNIDGSYCIVMERLFSLHYSSIDLKTKQKFCTEFDGKLRELHRAGFIHGDISFNNNPNYILTNTGIRLIDTGMSILNNDIDNIVFNNLKKQEVDKIEQVKEIILNICFNKKVDAEKPI